MILLSADTIRDSFFKWLSKQVSSAQLSDFFTILDETEAYCLNKHLIDRRLFEITDPEVIRKLGSSLEGNRLSRLWGYGRNKKRLEGLRYYTSFLENVYYICYHGAVVNTSTPLYHHFWEAFINVQQEV